ncbi:hypothetical protein [Kitasatospora sp. NPDC051914]|uniref:hypothetical protein n=1 Tax=Kitasatospora sp. NPDC051914 TaxID=3154945 RepID=UPI00344AA36F
MPTEPHPHRPRARRPEGPAAEKARRERAALAELGALLDELTALGPGEARFRRRPPVVVRRPGAEAPDGLPDLGATA